jgi:hypothetical protein
MSFFVLHGAGSDNVMDDLMSRLPYKNAAYLQKNTSYDSHGKETVIFCKAFIKNKKIRLETLTSNMDIMSVSIIRDGYVYSVLGNLEKGLKTSANPENLGFMKMSETAMQSKKIGEEIINGEKCGKYEYTRKIKGFFMDVENKITEYRNKDGFIMKSMSVPLDENNKETFLSEVIKLEKNPLINDSEFEIDKNMTYVDMTQDTTASSSGTEKSVTQQAESGRQPEDNEKDKSEELNNESGSKENVRQEVESKAVENVVEGAAGAVFKGIFGN